MNDIKSMSSDCSNNQLKNMNDLSEFDQENVRNLIINIQRKDCQKIPDLKDLYDLTKSLIGGLKKNVIIVKE
ncbi:hypothetical protein RhiirA1_452974 [Rhizophagus irregularis]|uniref:Uncharacterized protein n=1 Tax=Rhizophagus irregularis TaxID=588596 RepID=A0A2N0S8R1_9GLOM|nr:hypothetical protein RhiirA1_452974 [Rhizophagus irregularis]